MISAGAFKMLARAFRMPRVDATDQLVDTDGLPALSAFSPAIKGPKGSYAISVSPTTGVTLTNTQKPLLWHQTQGVAEFVSNTNIKGVGYGLGTKLYIIGTADQNFYVLDTSAVNPQWVKKTSGAINGGQGLLHLFWTNAAGVHFLAWAPNSGAGGQNLWRSTDDGTTWTKVIDSTTLLTANDYIGSIDEDGAGNTVATAYNGIDLAGGSPAPTKAIMLSTNGGQTWANIYSRVAAVNDYPRHVHCVYYAPYRDAWVVSGGDGGACKVVYSTDRLATFKVWTKSAQTTAMLDTPDAFLLQHDVAGYHDLVRIPVAIGAGFDAVAAQDPRSHVTFKLGTKRSPVAPVAGLAGDEFSFRAYRTKDGVCVFPIGKSSAGGRAAYLLSCDGGVTWVDGPGGTASTQSAAAQAGITIFGFEPILPSARRTDWDGRIIHYPNASTYVSRSIRVIPPPGVLYVHPTLGDDVHGDGSPAAPLKSFAHPGLPAGVRLKLLADYPTPVTIGANGIIIDRNGHTIGATPATGTLAVSENFEGTSSLTTTTGGGGASGSVVQNSTANPYVDPFLAAGGAKHARIAITTANDFAMLVKNNAFAGIADGTYVSTLARLSLNVASITSVLTFLQIQGGINVGIQTNGALQVTTVSDSRIYQQHSLDAVSVPLNSYFAVFLEVFKHPTSGWVKLWQITQDGPDVIMKLVIYVRDVNTSATSWTSWRMGIISGGQANLTMDVDNVAAGIGLDCSNPVPVPVVLGGVGQHLLPDHLQS